MWLCINARSTLEYLAYKALRLHRAYAVQLVSSETAAGSAKERPATHDITTMCGNTTTVPRSGWARRLIESPKLRWASVSSLARLRHQAPKTRLAKMSSHRANTRVATRLFPPFPSTPSVTQLRFLATVRKTYSRPSTVSRRTWHQEQVGSPYPTRTHRRASHLCGRAGIHCGAASLFSCWPLGRSPCFQTLQPSTNNSDAGLSWCAEVRCVA